MTRGQEWASIPPGWEALREHAKSREYAWDEEEHPRQPGDAPESKGGEFAPKGGEGAESKSAPKGPRQRIVPPEGYVKVNDSWTIESDEIPPNTPTPRYRAERAEPEGDNWRPEGGPQ